MANELPNVGADIILEFHQSINNVRMFGEAMETLDNKFGSMERRIDAVRSSLSSLSTQTSKGSGKNLRSQIERELNNHIAANGVVVANYGGGGLKINARTVQNVFAKVNKALNDKLANSYKDISIQVDPNLQVGKVPIQKDDMKEVNAAIARLVRVQLNNLVAALRKHGAGMISAQDLSSIQFHIGKGTVQQIIGKIKDHIKNILLNPNLGGGANFTMTDKDLERIYSAIKKKVQESINNAVTSVSGKPQTADLAPNIHKLQEAIHTSARSYITGITNSINGLNSGAITRPLSQVSKQLQNQMARDLGMKVSDFQASFANHRFSNADIHSADLRRQFGRLETELNKKIGGGLNEEIKRIMTGIQGIQLKYSPKLTMHLVGEINKINNQIVKKIREQIDLQFANMRAEINSVQVSPKDINRSRRVRDMGRLSYDDVDTRRRDKQRDKPLVNDPYARRDNYMNGFGLQGAVTNTLRHILAGSMVGAPMMLLYQSMEQFKTSQMEQLKMFSNFFAKATADTSTRAAQGDNRDATDVANDTIKNIMPFVKDTAQFYAVDYGKMSQVASVGSRLLNTEAEVKTFTDVTSKIYNIDREGDIVNTVAPGLEAFMGQFGLMVHELEERVARPMAVATNLTNATTEGIMSALTRSGSSFNSAGVTPEQAIAMVAASIKSTGLSGENIGNFYKSALPRLQSPAALEELKSIGIKVYEDRADGKKGMARPASEILSDVADKYGNLNDAASRDVIMKLFGTYQSSKGTTTLMEFEEIKEIMDAIKNFTEKDFNALMQNNATAPIMEVNRAGVSMNLALVDVMEQLTPEIVAVSKEIQDLAGGIREHKEALANFITFLGNALIGMAAVYGGRRLGQAAGVAGSIARTQTVDAIVGNKGVFGKGATPGTLMTHFGAMARQGAFDNTKENRAMVNRAMNNPVVAPMVAGLANMNKQQVAQMQAYMKDNNLRAKSMKDMVMIAQESKDYVAKTPKTRDQLWANSMYNSRGLYKDGMTGLNKGFADSLANDMQDRKKFDELGKTKQGKKIANFLGNLDENEMRKFQSHLDDMHRNTGKAVNSMGDLTHAVNTYTGAQAKNREELRRTNPHFQELNRVMRSSITTMGGSEMQRGIRNMDTFLGTLSSKARGAGVAFGGLAKSIAGFGAQMLLMAGIGWTVGSIADATKYRTKDEKIVRRGEREIENINAYRDYATKGFASQFGDLFWASIKGIGNSVTELWGSHDWVDKGDLNQVQGEFIKYLEENGMEKWPGSTEGRDPIRVRNFMNSKNKEEQDKLWNEFIEKDGNKELVKEASTRIFVEQLKQRQKESQDQAALQEGVTLEEAERRRQDFMKGSYRRYDYETIKKDIDERVGEYTLDAAIEQADAFDEGYASDSTKMMEIRRNMTDKIIALYQEQLDYIAQTVEEITKELEQKKSSGASKEEIDKTQDELNRWKNIQDKYGGEIKNTMNDVNKQQVQAEYEAAISRINRAQTKRDNGISTQEAINQATMDRTSSEYNDASISSANQRINSLNKQITELKKVPVNADQQQDVDQQIAALKNTIEQEKVKIRDFKLSSIGLYKNDMQDSLSQMSNDYLKAKVDSKITDESNPYLRNLRMHQYGEQVGLFNSKIADFQKQLAATSDPEAQKTIQREIRDLQRQSLQAQLGILDEMKSEGATFNLPDNVKAMSYYEYITRNNSHSTYTVQGGDTNVTVTLPNITDGTSADRIKQIGKAFGEGMNEGKNLRLQKQANPFGYRGGLL